MTESENSQIVVATDGGSGSRAALRWVADHLGARAAHVRIVTVAEAGNPEVSIALTAAERALGAIGAEWTVDAELLHGEPAHAIAEAAQGAALLVVGSRTGGGPLTSPRVPARVAGLATCPVVIVPDDWSPGTGPIVVGSSTDAASDNALELAVLIAEREGRALVLAHAWELPVVGDIPPVPGGPESIPERQREALDQIAVDVRRAHRDLEVTVDLRNGPAAASLAHAAAEAAMLIVGRRDRPAAVRVLLGSVSHRLIADPPCPVMVVPAPPPGIRTVGDVPDEAL
jgi:nucleotide-binding universal stress UspA family protein